jgi:Leucine-rich repeat (LRR) protein
LKLIFTTIRSTTSGKESSIPRETSNRHLSISIFYLRSKKAFDGLLQLLTLNLSQNAIETIPTDAFFGLVSLRKMDLSENLLEKLDNRTNSIFEDCLSLQEVKKAIWGHSICADFSVFSDQPQPQQNQFRVEENVPSKPLDSLPP